MTLQPAIDGVRLHSEPYLGAKGHTQWAVFLGGMGSLLGLAGLAGAALLALAGTPFFWPGRIAQIVLVLSVVLLFLGRRQAAQLHTIALHSTAVSWGDAPVHYATLTAIEVVDRPCYGVRFSTPSGPRLLLLGRDRDAAEWLDYAVTTAQENARSTTQV